MKNNIKYLFLLILQFLFFIKIGIGKFVTELDSTNCNCRQLNLFKFNYQLGNPKAVINEYYNDSILIVKYGFVEDLRNPSFDNFFEYSSVRDTFFIHNGNFLKKLEGTKYTVFSKELFFRKEETCRFFFEFSFIYKNRYIPMDAYRGSNDSMWFHYREIKSRVRNYEGQLDYKLLIKVPESNTVDSATFFYEIGESYEIYFSPKFGIIIDDYGLFHSSNYVYKTIQTENCDKFLKKKIVSYWR